MNCSEIRISVSAALDGEQPSIPSSVVDAHVAGCANCRTWSAEVTTFHRAWRVHPAVVEPDRTEAILAALPLRPARLRDERSRTLRGLTIAIAMVQLIAAVPLLFGQYHEMHGHLARHVGVLSVSLAVGLLIVAWRPERARSMLPILLVLVAGLVWSCLGDLLAGRPLPGSAVAHAANVAGLSTVWLLSRSKPGPVEADRDQRLVLR